MRPRGIGLAGLVLVVVGIVLIAAGAVAGGAGRGWFGTGNGGAVWDIGGMGPGMMGFAGGAGVAGQPVGSDEAAALGIATPAGATVDRSSNTITFTGTSVALTVLASPSDGPDETFRAAGLTNPTLLVPRGARVTVQLVNADAGMVHDWLVTSAQPPFPAMAMMGLPVIFGAVTPVLEEASSTAMPSATLTFVASAPGRYTYLCAVPGHAQQGMYGTLVVGS